MTTFIVVVLAILSVAFLYGMLSRETGFKILTTADGKPRFGVPGKFGSFFEKKKEEDKSAFQKWREEEKTEKELWFMYAVTAVLGITTSVLVSSVSDKMTGIIWAAIAVLLMLHGIVWPFYTKKTSTVSKWVLSGIIFFYPMAWLIPNFAEGVDGLWRIAKKGGGDGSAAVVRIADNYENGMPLLKAISPGNTPALQNGAVSKTIPVSQGVTSEVIIPIGYRFKSVECPKNVLMGIEGPNVPVGYMELDCANPMNVPSSVFIEARIGFLAKKGTSSTNVTVWFVPS